jgi:hypothetical protein
MISQSKTLEINNISRWNICIPASEPFVLSFFFQQSLRNLTLFYAKKIIKKIGKIANIQQQLVTTTISENLDLFSKVGKE